MKFLNSKKFISILSMNIFLILGYSLSGYATNSTTEPAPVASGVYEGEVIEVEEHTLVIKQTDGDIVRVRMPGKSGEKSSNFQVGDKLEVVVSPEGITTSVQHRLGH